MDSYAEIAAYYDCEHQSFHEDADLFLDLLTPGTVLEIGAGTGRITERLARAGHEVWAIEPSDAMLARARQRLAGLPGVYLVPSRVEDLALDRQLDNALLPLNTLWHLPQLDEQLAALRSVRRHLHPGAPLVVDLTNPYSMADRGGSGEVRQRFRTECDGRMVTGWSAAWDDEGQQRLDLSLTYDATGTDGLTHRTAASLHLRYLYRPELELLLRLAGFRVRQVYGSYQLDLYDTDSPNLIAVAEAGPQDRA